jgi:hypothetical protein
MVTINLRWRAGDRLGPGARSDADPPAVKKSVGSRRPANIGRALEPGVRARLTNAVRGGRSRANASDDADEMHHHAKRDQHEQEI